MSDSPLVPRTLPGAIVGMDPFNPLASVVVFQYNPETMRRRVEARTMTSDEGERTEALRLAGPPRETISLAIEFDDRDRPATSIGTDRGVTPQLAALEMLLYPKVATVIANMALAAAGNLEILPPKAPLTLFVWGPSRVLPVRVTGLDITEEQYDTRLNPLRAKVDLDLSVLSYHDLDFTNVGQAIFFAHQVAKEVFATQNVIGSAATLGVNLNFDFKVGL